MQYVTRLRHRSKLSMGTTQSRYLGVMQDSLGALPREFHDMTPHEKQHDSLDNSDAELKSKNAKFDQERLDSLDHAKQSGKGESGNKLPKPAGDDLAKP